MHTKGLIHSFFGRAICLVIIIAILQYCISDIAGLLTERTNRQRAAQAEITRMAGGEQLIEGPVFLRKIPQSPSPSENSNRPPNSIHITPFSKVDVSADISTEKLYRGIYHLQTFLTSVKYRAEIIIPSSPPNPEGPGMIEESAVIVIRLSHRKFIQSVTNVTLEGQSLRVGSSPDPDLLVFEVPPSIVKRDIPLSFIATVIVRGSKAISFAPLSHLWDLSVTSNSPHPSFSGDVLPLNRSITETSSSARWHSDPFSTSIQCYPLCPSLDQYFSVNKVVAGVKLLDGVTIHSMVNRAIKYQSLFIVLIFAAYALVEILCRVRLHPMNYLLVGAALSLFFLLLLSLAEQVGFPIAYVVASFTTTGLITGYSTSILKSTSHGYLVGVLLSGTYAFLYSVLQEQDRALLFGASGLTIGLAVLMFITRRVDWYTVIPVVVPSVRDQSTKNPPVSSIGE